MFKILKGKRKDDEPMEGVISLKRQRERQIESDHTSCYGAWDLIGE